MNFIMENFVYKVTFTGGKEVVVEGHKGIASYSPEEVVVRIKGGKLSIKGENIVIKEVNTEELFLDGKFNGIEVQKL